MSTSENIFSFITSGLCGLAVFMFLAWLLSLKLKDASIVDRFWGLNFILLALIYFFQTKEIYWRHLIILLLLFLWGARLSLHIHWRNHGHPEDYRYQAMRKNRGTSFWWYSLFSVFFLQGVLAFLIASPILLIFAGEKAPISFFDFVGIIFWGIGFYFEVMGDRQLKKFKADPKNKGKILDQGLWALTRHPNYFGDALIWWALFLLALPVKNGWMSVLGPIIMSFFLRYVSGVALLEKSLSKNKPGYNEYVRNTPAFAPRFGPVCKYFCNMLAKKT